MNHDELRFARESMGLTPAEAAELLEVDVSSVYKWERDPSMSTHRPAPARVAKLLAAYKAGYRPPEWPNRLLEREVWREEIKEVRR